MRLPPGFILESGGARAFVFRADRGEELHRLGLDDPLRWEALLGRGGEVPGRGATVRVREGKQAGLFLKQMRRGGFAGPLWRERFRGTPRLFANLELPLEALRRGVPTAAPVALLVLEGPRGLFRGWLALEEIEHARDLKSRLAIPPPPGEREIKTVLGLVRRMHDAGIEHRDLNLGNLLVREAEGSEAEPFVVDLDRALLHPRPLGFAARQSALRRLERSYLKWFGAARPLRALGASPWYALYAGADEQLARRFERGRLIGRTLLALHGRSRGE